MIDVPHLLTRMVETLQAEEFPNAGDIAAALDLDMSAARVIITPRGPLGIDNARLTGGDEVDVIGAIEPKREIVLLFSESRIPYRDFVGAALGPNQRIQYSKYSPGLAILFDVGQFLGILTASGSDGIVQSLSLEARKAANIG
jgi:hypothetical protein